MGFRGIKFSYCVSLSAMNDIHFFFLVSFLFSQIKIFFFLGHCVQPPPIQPTDNQLSLADIDTIKVIGKGSGGIVQLVRHKWTGQFFALKVLY